MNHDVFKPHDGFSGLGSVIQNRMERHKDKILTALKNVIDPDLNRDIVSLNFVKEVEVEKKEKELYDKIKADYDKQISPYYAASRIWTDAVINPLDTRKWISTGIEAANHAPIEKKFNLGVIQV